MEWWLILTIVLASVGALLLLATLPAFLFGGFIAKGIVKSSKKRAEAKKAKKTPANVEEKSNPKENVQDGGDAQEHLLVTVEKKAQPQLSVDFAMLVKEISDVRSLITESVQKSDVPNAQKIFRKWFCVNAKTYHSDLNPGKTENENDAITLRCQRFLEFVSVARKYLENPASQVAVEKFINFKVIPEQNDGQSSVNKVWTREENDKEFDAAVAYIQKMLTGCIDKLEAVKQNIEDSEERLKGTDAVIVSFSEENQEIKEENQEIKEEARLAKARTEKLEKESQKVKKESQEVKERMAKAEKEMEEMKRMLFTLIGQKGQSVEEKKKDSKDDPKSGPGFFEKNE